MEDSLAWLAFPKLDAGKASSNNMPERLNKEVRRQTGAAGIFPNLAPRLRFVTAYPMEYPMEYPEDWPVAKSCLSEGPLQSLNEQAAYHGFLESKLVNFI